MAAHIEMLGYTLTLSPPPSSSQVRGGLTEKVAVDRTVQLRFTNVGKLPPPVLQFTQVTFGYSADKVSTAGAR